MKNQAAHANAVQKFYRHEAVTLIDFRTALEVVADIAQSEDVSATFYTERDAELLEASAQAIRQTLKTAQENLANARAIPDAAAFFEAKPSSIAMSVFPLEEYPPNNC